MPVPAPSRMPAFRRLERALTRRARLRTKWKDVKKDNVVVTVGASEALFITAHIFYERGDVLTISMHADPEGEYPYYSGYASEVGAGPGAGCHKNFPLPAGTEDANYLATLVNRRSK